MSGNLFALDKCNLSFAWLAFAVFPSKISWVAFDAFRFNNVYCFDCAEGAARAFRVQVKRCHSTDSVRLVLTHKDHYAVPTDAFKRETRFIVRESNHRRANRLAR